jgi:hypothetical protein
MPADTLIIVGKNVELVSSGRWAIVSETPFEDFV